jgi:hypothetical protein
MITCKMSDDSCISGVQIKSVLDKRYFNVNNVNVGSIALAILVREYVFNFD